MKKSRAQFERTYFLIKLLRGGKDAPVDESGPRAIADAHAPPRVFRYHILCALQLSSMTKDQKVHEAMNTLKKYGLTVENIAKTSIEHLEEMIKPVGFYRRKSVYMRDTANILIEKHGGEVPNNIESLIELPGIGPKMAHITLSEAYGITEGIGVDSHMHRICNQLGWVTSKTPEETQAQLESFIPREEWGKINHEIVGLGQMLQQPIYRVRLAQALLAIEDEIDFQESFSLLKRLGFVMGSIAKVDESLHSEIENRVLKVKRPRKFEEHTFKQ